MLQNCFSVLFYMQQPLKMFFKMFHAKNICNNVVKHLQSMLKIGGGYM